MSYDYSYAMEELMGTMGASLLLNVPTMIFGIAAYVLTALSLYTIAKRRGIAHAWLSWLPVVDVWILGSIADQYRYVARGQVKSKRKILIWLNVITNVLAVGLIVAMALMFFNALNVAMYGGSEDEIMSRIMGPMLGILGLCLPIVGLSITTLIFRYMALYDLYMSCEPNNGVLFIILSILINLTEPFFLIFLRNKDNGMPPRRQEIPSAPNYQTYRSSGNRQNDQNQNNQNYQTQNYQTQNYQTQNYQTQNYQNPAQQPPQLPQNPEDEEHFL